MKNVCTLLLSLFVVTLSFSQEKDSTDEEFTTVSQHYFPIECLDSIVFLEKLEEVSSYELSMLIAEKMTTSKKDGVIEGIDYYNSVTVLRHNQQVEEIASNEEYTNFATFYKRETESVPRYSVISKVSFSRYSPNGEELSYAVFDNQSNTRYAYFGSLDFLVASLSKSRKYMANGVSRDQDDLNLYAEKQVAKLERKERNKGSGATTFWLILAGVLGVATLLGNLVTL